MKSIDQVFDGDRHRKPSGWVDLPARASGGKNPP
jgi:hypothetical protein